MSFEALTWSQVNKDRSVLLSGLLLPLVVPRKWSLQVFNSVLGELGKVLGYDSPEFS